MTPVAHHIAELVNISPNPQQPYVGNGGVRTQGGPAHERHRPSARRLRAHRRRTRVGNGTRFVVSELAGRSTLALKAEELGLEPALGRSRRGARDAEVARAPAATTSRSPTARWSSCCAGRRAGSPTTSSSRRSGSSPTTTASASTEATVKVRVSGERVVATAEGNGPVNALDSALRQAIGQYYPSLAHIHLIDYRVRVLDTNLGTGAVTRVLIDTTDGEVTWTTIGVSENIIEASWQALYDSIVYGLLHSGDGVTVRTDPAEDR